MHSGQYQADGGKGAISTQSFTQYNGAGGLYYAAAADGHHLEQNNLDASDKGAGFTQYHDQYETNQGSGAAYVNTGGYEEVDVNKQHVGEVISNQQAKNIEHFGSGIAGSINIIGGGFSAVGKFNCYIASYVVSNTTSTGPVSEGAALHISSHVENGNDDVPALVLTDTKLASVPIAPVVPVPGIKTVAGFETISGKSTLGHDKLVGNK